MFEIQAAQAGHRQQNGIVVAFFQLAETRIDVTADGLDDEIGPQNFKLSGTASGTRADNRTLSQIIEAAAEKGIARIFALWDGGDRKSQRSFGGQVFEAVDGEIDVTGE